MNKLYYLDPTIIFEPKSTRLDAPKPGSTQDREINRIVETIDPAPPPGQSRTRTGGRISSSETAAPLAAGPSMKKKTVVALARQLAIDLWRWRKPANTRESATDQASTTFRTRQKRHRNERKTDQKLRTKQPLNPASQQVLAPRSTTNLPLTRATTLHSVTLRANCVNAKEQPWRYHYDP